MRIIRRIVLVLGLSVMTFLATFPLVNAMISYSESRITNVEEQHVPAPGETGSTSIAISANVTPIP